jgi:hypothetical protein
MAILMIFHASCVYKYERQKSTLTKLHFIIGPQNRTLIDCFIKSYVFN